MDNYLRVGCKKGVPEVSVELLGVCLKIVTRVSGIGSSKTFMDNQKT